MPLLHAYPTTPRSVSSSCRWPNLSPTAHSRSLIGLFGNPQNPFVVWHPLWLSTAAAHAVRASLMASINSPSFPPPPPPSINPNNNTSHPSAPNSSRLHSVSPSAPSFGVTARYHVYHDSRLSSPHHYFSPHPVSPQPIPSPLSPPRSAAISPSGQSAAMASRASSSAMVVEYNPQQWGGARSSTSGQYIPHSAMPPSRPLNPEDGRK